MVLVSILNISFRLIFIILMLYYCLRSLKLSLKFIDLHKNPDISISSFHLWFLNQTITGSSRYSNYLFLRVIGLTLKLQSMIDILKILRRSVNFEILLLRTNPSNLIQGIVIFHPWQYFHLLIWLSLQDPCPKSNIYWCDLIII